MIITAHLFLNNLQNGYMDINDANLLIFDECHHATALHPFKQVSTIHLKCIKIQYDKFNNSFLGVKLNFFLT